jgi:hypothetical protein
MFAVFFQASTCNWKRYLKINRVITPTDPSYRLGGKIIQKMPDQRKDVKPDVLIVVTARETGAEVWTSHKDFLRTSNDLELY